MEFKRCNEDAGCHSCVRQAPTREDDRVGDTRGALAGVKNAQGPCGVRLATGMERAAGASQDSESESHHACMGGGNRIVILPKRLQRYMIRPT